METTFGDRGGVVSAFRAETRVRGFARERRGGGVPVRGEEWIRGARSREATGARADALAPGSGRGGGARARNARGEGRTATAGRRIERARCEGGARTRDAGRQAHRRGRRRAARRDARPPWRRPARGREASEARRAARAVAAARNRADAEAAVGVATADIIAARSLGPHARERERRPFVRRAMGRSSGRVPLDPSRRGRARGAFGGSGLVLRRGERTGASVRGEPRSRRARVETELRAVASTENDAPDGPRGEQKVCHASSSRRASVEPIARAHGEEFVNAERPRGRRASRPGRKKKARAVCEPSPKVLETRGIDPLTFCMQSRRSTI